MPQKNYSSGNTENVLLGVSQKGINKEPVSHGFQNQTLTLEQLADHIKAGLPFTAALTNGHRKKENFLSSQIIGIDFDTSDARLDPFVSKHAALVYTTASHTPAKPRTRALFMLPAPVSDPQQYKQMVERLHTKFGRAIDTSTSAVVQLWFGSKDCDLTILGNVLDINELPSLPTEPEHVHALALTPLDAGLVDTICAYWLSHYRPKAVVGSRNKAGFDLACQLRDSGIAEERAAETMRQYQAQVPQGDSPYTLEEALEGLRQAYSRPPREPAPNMPLMVNRKIEVRDAAYALQPREPIQYLVTGLIAERSNNIIVGKFGSKKTFAALSLAVSVAIGKSWAWAATTQCAVLIIDEESGDTRLSMRLGNTIRGMGGDETTPVFYISLAGFNLLKNTGDEALLEAYINQLGVRLVIIDALADIMAGGDENAVKDTQPVFLALRRIAENSGAAIVVLHHTNKGGGERGSTAIPAAVDTMIKVESNEGSPIINFKSLKNRDGIPFNFSLEAHWESDKFFTTDVFYRGNKSIHYSPLQQFVLKYLREHGATTATDIIASGDEVYAKEGLKSAIKKLVADGVVRRTNPDSSKREGAIYELVQEVE